MAAQEAKILLVDDEATLLQGTKRFLESEGYIVFSASNASEAMEILNSSEIDIAVIDYKMPDTNGLTLLKEIKSKYPLIVCFILTAFASYKTATNSIRLGAYDFVPKPVTPDELTHLIERGYKQRLLLLEKEKLRKEREETLIQLAREKSRLNTIINIIQDGVLVINKFREIVYYNPAALKYLRLHKIKIGQNILDKLPKKAGELVEKHLTGSGETKNSYSVQIEMVKENSFIEVVSSPVSFPNGAIAGVVLVIRDITEFKKIELIKSQFVSMVAHELKAPLAGVQGFIKLILDKSIKLTEEQIVNYLERSNARLDNLHLLINELLDISRMELGNKYREIIELNVNEIIISEIENIKEQCAEKHIRLETKLDDSLPKMKFDEDEFRRIIINLLSNAIKYNKNNGSIIVETKRQSNYIAVIIKDFGIGIKKDDLNKIFNDFYRVKCRETKNISGTGLGLSIVKKIVESYHGKIEVESEYGKGTTFKIYIPIKNGVSYGSNCNNR